MPGEDIQANNVLMTNRFDKLRLAFGKKHGLGQQGLLIDFHLNIYSSI